MDEVVSTLIPGNESHIPVQLDEMDAAWLTQALRRDGHLTTGKVSEVRIEPIGEGEGFMGVLGRFHLEYEGDAGNSPVSLIVKLPSLTDSNRMLGELMGAYWREIHFYEELSSGVGVNTPAVYYSNLTPDPVRPRINMIMRVVEMMPSWLVDIVMERSKEVVGTSEHRYVLLIEDLSPAKPGDQLQGGTPERCEAVLSVAAKMHAHNWQSPILDSAFWINDPRVTMRSRHQMLLESRESFVEKYSEKMGDWGMILMNWYYDNGVQLHRLLYRRAPHTVVHGDMRLDNVFFDETSSDTRVVFADWQTVGRGLAAEEVAYFLSGALDVDTSAEIEEDLIRHYHSELVNAGVNNYDFERFRKDYDRGMMAMLRVHGSATIDVDVGEERGGELMNIWMDRTLARLRSVDLTTLL